MSSSSSQEKSLTESDVLVSSQQYDAGLVYHASLPRKGFTVIAPNALDCCQALRLLDLSGNKMTSIEGLSPVAPQLTFLNLAENRLTDISVLAQCAALEYCFLEGNELSSTSALQPLTALPLLIELVLQRTVSLASEGPQETLLLDNPVCRQAASYTSEFVRRVPHIRWVDGVSAFKRGKALAAADGSKGDEKGQDCSNTALLQAAAASQKALQDELARDNAEEAALMKLLAEAGKRCQGATKA